MATLFFSLKNILGICQIIIKLFACFINAD